MRQKENTYKHTYRPVAQVIGIAEHDATVKVHKLLRGDTLERALGSHWSEEAMKMSE